MRSKEVLLVIVFIVSSQVDIGEGSLEAIFDQCCTFGTGWAQSRTTCTGYPVPVPGLPSEHQKECLSALEICCIRTHRSKKCEWGKEMARLDQPCAAPPVLGGETQKDCCEGCKLGLIAASKKTTCLFVSFSFGNPWDEAFYDCCTRQSNEVVPHTHNRPHMPGSFSNKCTINNPCAQKCIDTGVAVHCDCYPGYKLAADKHSCEDINECELRTHTCNPSTEECQNVIGGFQCILLSAPRTAQTNNRDPCPAGYSMSQETRTCDDIDECNLQIDTCDRQTETCSNTIGSFKCTNQTPTLCPPGFKYHEETKRCIDVDECAEGLDDCNRDQEFCLNSFGAYQCQSHSKKECPAGYKWNSNQATCEDIDECAEGTHDCNPETQTCINAVATFRCVSKTPECPRGYKKNIPNNRCEDINECTEATHDCNLNTQYCVNTLGSYQCQTKVHPPVQKCGTGFIADPNTGICRDVNECEESSPCSSNQVCENTLGSYRCVCQQGYAMNPATRVCEDINECQRGMHNCMDTSQRCDNTIGSFTCVRVTSCGTGYTLNAATGECEDDDECSLNSHSCGQGFVCRNTLGSFRCDRVQCPPGQKLLSDGSCQVIHCSSGMAPDPSGNCVDINECSNRTACRSNQRCINTVGSYRCQNLLTCPGGYELNEHGNQCVDIDECARRIHDCGSNQICQNRPGGYTCICPAGYSLSARRECEDIDECVQYQRVCSISSECQNTPGSYTCICKAGFKHADSGKTCVDIDECAESPNTCQHNCINVWGSYQCSCQQGYTLSSDGRSCQDIDECTLWKGRGNLCIGFCLNEPGSYSCSCPEGYRLGPDHRTCQDIDECQEQHICKGENEVCLNTRGGFKCNTIICPPNYVRDRDHRKSLQSDDTVLCKKRCQSNDIDCIMNNTQTITFQGIALPTLHVIPSPLIVTTMRAITTGSPLKFDTDYVILEGNLKEYFDVLRGQGVGSLRLIKPIIGPLELNIKLEMLITLRQERYRLPAPLTRHLAYINIIVSKYEF